MITEVVAVSGMMVPEPPSWYRRLLAECPPTAHTIPDWGCGETLHNFNKYMAIADLLGVVLMPWQKLSLAILAMPRCFELVEVVGRQQGKTVAETIPIVDTLLTEAHTAVYSAQKGVDAERKIRQEFKPLIWKAGMDETVGLKFNNGTGDFGIHGVNGAHLRTMSSDANSLRGETRVKLGIIDEARSDKDHTRSRLMSPATTVVSDAKMITSSTAGDVTSLYLNETQDKAREVVNDPNSTICLLEYSLDGDIEYDPADPKLWKKQLPALGYTVTTAAIRRQQEKLEPHDFAMEYLGRRLPMAVDVAIPPDVWRAVCGRSSGLVGRLVLSIDSPPEQDRTAAVVCDKTGQLELISVRASGSETAYDWAHNILLRNKDIRTVALANNNTLRRTGERLRIAGYEVKWYDTKAMHMAASRFWEAVHSEPRQVFIQDNPTMNEANAGAFGWTLASGGWVFMRQTPEDFVSPLIAATMAYDTAIKPGEVAIPIDDDEAIWLEAIEDPEPDLWDIVAGKEGSNNEN